eukprot:TRINITY_DN61_c0_g1_i1.p1 TRINITY_DN61_c0_g1~~TRINITY_DN61_c0_g1_i1.p1  ORF type:complete len:125 (-),score=26.60 TRINITY_DN61_c0_g1_i1:119-493(-)
MSCLSFLWSSERDKSTKFEPNVLSKESKIEEIRRFISINLPIMDEVSGEIDQEIVNYLKVIKWLKKNYRLKKWEKSELNNWKKSLKQARHDIELYSDQASVGSSNENVNFDWESESEVELNLYD